MIDALNRFADWYIDLFERAMPNARHDTVTIVMLVAWWLFIFAVFFAGWGVAQVIAR